MNITTLELGAYRANCYIIHNPETKRAVIIDPGDESQLVISKCNEMQLAPEAILLTHGHFDHFMGVRGLVEELDIPVYAGLLEKEILADPSLNRAEAFGQNDVKLTEANWLNDGSKLEVAGFNIKVIATPGHTIGCLCYYFEEENTLFTGDTIFKGTYGITTLPTGHMPSLIDSIKQKLFTLPDQTLVYPGHGQPTKIAAEMLENMIIKAWE